MVGEYIFKITFPCTLIHQNTYNSDMIVKSISIQVSSCPASVSLLPCVLLNSLFGGTGVSEATPSGAMVPFLFLDLVALLEVTSVCVEVSDAQGTVDNDSISFFILNTCSSSCLVEASTLSLCPLTIFFCSTVFLASLVEPLLDFFSFFSLVFVLTTPAAARDGTLRPAHPRLAT